MSKFEVLIGDSGRGFFEHDATVHSELQVVEKIAEGYKKAVNRATRSALRAVQHGHKSDVSIARWDEAVCQTLEMVLCLFDITDCVNNDEWSYESLRHPIHPKSIEVQPDYES